MSTINNNSWITPRAKGYENLKKKESFNQDVCYNNIIDYDGHTNPHFFNVVINSKVLNENSKTQFLEHFWTEFSDPDNIFFRKNVYGKYLFWINGEFMGCINCLEDANNYGTYRDDKIGIYIGEEFQMK